MNNVTMAVSKLKNNEHVPQEVLPALFLYTKKHSVHMCSLSINCHRILDNLDILLKIQGSERNLSPKGLIFDFKLSRIFPQERKAGPYGVISDSP